MGAAFSLGHLPHRVAVQRLLRRRSGWLDWCRRADLGEGFRGDPHRHYVRVAEMVISHLFPLRVVASLGGVQEVASEPKSIGSLARLRHLPQGALLGHALLAARFVRLAHLLDQVGPTGLAGAEEWFWQPVVA